MRTKTSLSKYFSRRVSCEEKINLKENSKELISKRYITEPERKQEEKLVKKPLQETVIELTKETSQDKLFKMPQKPKTFALADITNHQLENVKEKALHDLSFERIQKSQNKDNYDPEALYYKMSDDSEIKVLSPNKSLR